MKKIILILIVFIGLLSCNHKSIPVEKELSTPEPNVDVSKGRLVYDQKCGQCHELKNVALYTNQQWNRIQSAMIPKVKLNVEEKSQLILYVQGGAK